MASGWNLWVWYLWMWLECIGVVLGGVVRRYIDFLIILLIPTPLVLAFFAAASLHLCSFLKCFFVIDYMKKLRITI